MIGNLFLAFMIASVSASALSTNNFNDVKPKLAMEYNSNHSYFYNADCFSFGYMSYEFGMDDNFPFHWDGHDNNLDYFVRGYTFSNNLYSHTVSYNNLESTLHSNDVAMAMVYRIERRVDNSYHFVFFYTWAYKPYIIYDINGNVVSSYLPNMIEVNNFVVNDRNSGTAPNISVSRTCLNSRKVVNDNVNSQDWNCLSYFDSYSYDFAHDYYYIGSDYLYDISITYSQMQDIDVGSNPFYEADILMQIFYFDEMSVSYDTAFAQGYDTGYSNGISIGYSNGYAEGLSVATGTNASWLGLMSSIADTPIVFLRDMFSFELFGMNVAVIILSLLTAIIVFGIVKKVWK